MNTAIYKIQLYTKDKAIYSRPATGQKPLSEPLQVVSHEKTTCVDNADFRSHCKIHLGKVVF